MDPVKDEALDRDIERALAVDPSPDFTARVRARIAEEPPPSARGFGWLFAGVTASALAAAGVIVMIVLRPAPSTGPSERSLAARSLAAGAGSLPAGMPGLRDDRGTTHDEHRTTHPARRTSNDERRTTSVEPLFDARETAALQRLIASVRDARVDLAPLMREAQPAPMEFEPVQDLVIPTITIEPLVSGGVEGERP
jgi:hypothetical protein